MEHRVLSKIACADLGWNLNLMTRLAFSKLYQFTAKLDWLQYWDMSWSFWYQPLKDPKQNATSLITNIIRFDIWPRKSEEAFGINGKAGKRKAVLSLSKGSLKLDCHACGVSLDQTFRKTNMFHLHNWILYIMPWKQGHQRWSYITMTIGIYLSIGMIFTKIWVQLERLQLSDGL